MVPRLRPTIPRSLVHGSWVITNMAAARPVHAPIVASPRAASDKQMATASTTPATPSDDDARELFVANVYISEGRHEGRLSQLRSAAAGGCGGSHLLHVFVDGSYNRTGFTIGGVGADGVQATVVQLCQKAFALLDLTESEAWCGSAPLQYVPCV
jgi:hypothetical protein